jgi:LAO/AO transport system kinase
LSAAPASAASSRGPRRRQFTAEEYYEGVRSANVAVLARALTLIESSSRRHQRLAEGLLTRLLPHTGNAIRVGITGAPGAGKSTFIQTLGLHLVRRGHRLAVLAVDPSSGVSGGSILGDKTRMPELAAETNAYIRPSPSAGTLGGVARKTRETMLVFEAAGYDVVLVETVGVGQSETVVAEMTDCFLALMLPGAGDELQGIKRGLLELVDVIAVNKADGTNRAAAQVAAQQYDVALKSLVGRRTGDQVPAVLTCSALEREGVDRVWAAVAARYAALKKSSQLTERRRRQNLRWLWATVHEQLRQMLRNHPDVRALQGDLEKQVLAGTLPPEAAARQILEAFGAC